MTNLRISEAARLLGVSDDTVRRLVAAGDLTSGTGDGPQTVDGRSLAEHLKSAAPERGGSSSSARNRFTGLVTAVKVDGVMAQVELQCGPFRVVSLMSSEAATDLGLEIGSVAAAVVKSTNVVIEVP